MKMAKRLKKDESALVKGDSMLDVLPTEILIRIFDHLPAYQRLQMGLVCQRWRDIIEMNVNRYKYSVTFSHDGKDQTDKNNISFRLFGKSPADWSRFLKNIGWGLHSIKFVDVYGYFCHGILQVVAHNCPRLRSLEMPINGVYPGDIAVLAQCCKHLETFCIKNTATECDNVLEKLFRKNPKLSDLTICLNNNITGSCLKVLAEKKRHLKRIVISSGSVNTEYLDFLRDIEVRQFVYRFAEMESTREMTVLENVSQAGESLVHLELDAYNNWFDNDFKQLSRLTGLVVLNLRGCKQLNEYHLIAITSNCRRLRAINLSRCTRIGDTGVCPVLALPELRALDLSGVPIKVRTFFHLPLLMPKMTYIRVNCNHTNIARLGLLRVIECAPRLRIFKMSGIADNRFVEMVSQRRISNSAIDKELMLFMPSELPDTPAVWILKPNLEVEQANLNNPKDIDNYQKLQKEIKDDIVSGLSEKEKPNFPDSSSYLPW